MEVACGVDVATSRKGRLRLVGLERARGLDVSSEDSMCNILDGSSSLALNVSSEKIARRRELMPAGERASHCTSPENRLDECAIRDSD